MIVLHRSGAFGDVLLATAVAARLRREEPSSMIVVSTKHPHAFHLNPDVDMIVTHGQGSVFPVVEARLINLDLVSEMRPDVHPMDAYFEAAFGDLGEATDKSVVYTRSEGLPRDLEGDWSNTITIHPNVSWYNRTLPFEWWCELARTLRRLGWRVLSLGTRLDHDITPTGAIDTRLRLSTPQQAMLIHKSAAFVCFTSGPIALGGSTDTPIVSLHTISNPKFSSMYRHGELGWNSIPVVTPLECNGCHDRRRAEDKVMHMDCPLGHADCVRSFLVESVVDAVERAVAEDLRAA